ncbi:hypothetical protein Tco_0458709 [Tanacetum coccineum]
MIRRRHGKTPYELLHNKPPDLSYLHVFGALCYPTNDSENLGKLQPKADIGIFIGYAPTKKIFPDLQQTTPLHEMPHVSISSGLVPNPSPSTPFVPPSRSDWDLLFQPMFDESLNVDLHAPEVIAPIPEAVAPEHAVSTGSPSSTTVDQDAPSPSNSPGLLSHDVEEDNHDIEVAHMGNDPYFGIPIPEVLLINLHQTLFIQLASRSPCFLNTLAELTKDNPRETIIGALDRPVSTRLQLHEQALFCYYDAFLTSVWELFLHPDKHLSSLLSGSIRSNMMSLGGILKKQGSDGPLRGYVKKRVIDFEDFIRSALHSWYDMLSSFLISNDFSKGSVDPTLFIRREGNELILISQSPRGIFINQSKYALESLKKYGYESCDPVDTPMVEKSKLDEDKEGNAVDPSHYRGMIGTLLYLTASRPDLQFAICMCARYQARPTEKHLNAVKRIFRYLKGTVHQGLWYPKDSSFALTAFADADHAGCQDTRRSTSGSIQLLGDRLVSWSSKRQKSAAISSTEAEYIALSGCCAQIFMLKCVVIELYFVNTEYQLADIFTKALGRERIEFLINKLGMRSFTPDTLKQLADEVDE